MSEALKKIVDFGLETQNRLVDFLSDFLSKARMDEGERKQFVADLGDKLERNREKGEKLVKDLMDKMPNPMIFAKQREVGELKTHPIGPERVDRDEQNIRQADGGANGNGSRRPQAPRERERHEEREGGHRSEAPEA